MCALQFDLGLQCNLIAFYKYVSLHCPYKMAVAM